MDDESVARGRARLETSLGRAVRREKLSADEAEEAFARLSFTTDLGDLADRQLVVRR